MKRWLIFFSLLLLCAAPARAQFTTVSATITDPNGIPYANATVSMRLVPSTASPTLNGQSCCGSTAATTNSAGTFIANLADNNVVLPAGTQWEFTVSISPGIPSPLGTGPQSFTVAPITITGATQSVSAALTAAAPALTNFATGSSGTPGGNAGDFQTNAGGGLFGGVTPTGAATDCLLGTSVFGACPGGSVAGLNTQLQYNNAGAFGGTTGVTYDSVLQTLSMQLLQLSDSTVIGAPAANLYWLTIDSGTTRLVCTRPDTTSCLPDTSGFANVTLSNLGTTNLNSSILFDTDNLYTIGTALIAPATIYYHSLVAVGGNPVTFEGAVAACTAAGALNGKIAFTATGPQWSYNTGACTAILLASNANVPQITPTDDSVPVGDGSAWQGKVLPNCVDTGGNHLNYTIATNAFSCGTSGSGGGIASINGDSTAAQSIVTASTGTDFTIGTAGGVTTVAIPDASATARGLVTTGTQTFAGSKTFSSSITVTGVNGSGTNPFVAPTTASGNLFVRALDSSSASITGTLTARGGEYTGTGNFNSGGANFRGGDNSSTGTGTTAQVTVRSGDLTGAGSGAAGALVIRGGDTAGTGAPANTSLRPGGSSNATPSAPGLLIISQTAIKGATVSSGATMCASADNTVADCATSATNVLGIATTTTDPIIVQVYGRNSVAMLYDITNAGDCNGTNCTTTVGHYVCSSANTAGKVQPQSTACAAGRQVGIIFKAEATVTSAAIGSIWLQRM